MSNATKLKEINSRAADVSKLVKETEDPALAQVYIAELANDAYVLGIESAREELAKVLEPVNVLAKRKGL